MWGNHRAPWNWWCSSPNPSGNAVITFPRTKTDLFQNQSTFAHQSSWGPCCKEAAKSFNLLFPTLTTFSSPLCHGGAGQGIYLLLPANEVWGKVIFFSSVWQEFCPCGGGGSASVHAGIVMFVTLLSHTASSSWNMITIYHKKLLQTITFCFPLYSTKWSYSATKALMSLVARHRSRVTGDFKADLQLVHCLCEALIADVRQSSGTMELMVLLTKSIW